ncbi:hypothetical protein ABTM50_19360, partial [Acinetobacter baumannii]
ADALYRRIGTGTATDIELVAGQVVPRRGAMGRLLAGAGRTVGARIVASLAAAAFGMAAGVTALLLMPAAGLGALIACLALGLVLAAIIAAGAVGLLARSGDSFTQAFIALANG